MEQTPDAIRDLVKRLRAVAAYGREGFTTVDEGATALEQLLEAVEEADRVIEPFADRNIEIDKVAVIARHGHSGTTPVAIADLRAASAWRAKHGAGR